MRWLLVLTMALLATPAFAQLHPTSRAVVTQAIEQAIRPGFADYAKETGQLEKMLGGLCDEPSEAGLTTARAQFGTVVLAWSRIELYKIGPLLTDNRADKILYWPDRKGIGLKQVQAILSKPDWDAFDAETLKGKSVAVQGLGALEFVLFGTDSERLGTIEADFRCHYALAIATLLAETATQMSAEWNDPEGISRRLIFPTAGDADYRTATEVQEALVGLLAHGLEAVRDQRLLPFLGTDGKAKPKSALFWRSVLTVPSIAANFDGLNRLLTASELVNYAPSENATIGTEAAAEFARAAASAATVSGPLDAALADPAQVAALNGLVESTRTLAKLLGDDLPAALGLSVGFSSLDGD
jgi:hypothetical protein